MTIMISREYIMNDIFNKALISGVERISAWSDLLDEINVYPVADGDTGRNLLISMSPLRQISKDRSKTVQTLLLAARGNSGNIAARFFSGFLTADSEAGLSKAANLGRDYAWTAVYEPKKGTMLTVFDALCEAVGNGKSKSENKTTEIIDHLEKAVHSTVNLLPRLKKANVVDAGALGMFIFFEGFFNAFAGDKHEYRPIMKVFNHKLAVSSSFKEDDEAGYCVDMVLKADENSAEAIKKAQADKSAVIIQDKDYIKIHIHTDNTAKARDKFSSYGLVKWEDDDIGAQIKEFKTSQKKQAIHIMTDGAGSVTNKDVKSLGITLLDSYIIAGDKCIPETHLETDELYRLMSRGIKASTSQASVFERHQHYQSVLSRYKKVLYLCVGSVYTGNYKVAADWKKKNDPDNRMTVMDTGTASGRLGLLAIACARYSRLTSKPDEVIKFAEKAIDFCYEYIFLEKLHYLAAGGRMSKAGAFFGDIFNVKPVVSPHATGAAKMGIARNNIEQMKFLFEKMESNLKSDSKALFMLEYTDNFSWVENVLKKEIINKYPHSEILLQPLSLTTGVHTGPGTWAVAFLDIEALD